LFNPYADESLEWGKENMWFERTDLVLDYTEWFKCPMQWSIDDLLREGVIDVDDVV
jgi:hypothetical protein